MRTLLTNAFTAALLFFAASLFSQNLFINEFLASNSTVLADEFGGFDDWVEIYNAEAFSVDIGGMFVTDDLANPTKWQIPNTDPAKSTIPAGGYLILWFDGEPTQGVLHVSPKLGSGGEDIGLFASNGTQIDGLTFGPQTANISYGRLPDGGAVLESFSVPTPGAMNTSSPGGTLAEMPTASIGGGFYTTSFSVELTSTTPNASIRYTLDGSDPTDVSTLYTGWLFVDQTTTLRAKAYATGFSPSNTATFTYLFENSHTFPVVALSFNDADFFDPVTGIYPNYLEDWERPVHVELFETDGTKVLSQRADVEIQGTGSAQLPQKSLRVEALASGGSGFFEYPVFPDQPFDKYERFVMRNSGQDWNVTMFRDAMVASLSNDLSDVGGIIQPPKLIHQAYRPGVVYLNGEYWGIHNLREHMKSEYIEQHFGLKDTEMDLLSNNEVDDGTDVNWDVLEDFMLNNDFSNNAAMAQFSQMVDLPNFLDYYVFNIIIDNSDWPGNNYRRFRAINNGVWRFMTFDLDFSFGLFNHVPGGSTWNTGDASANALARSLDDSQVTWPNPQWFTLYFRKAVENDQFRTDYINRTADFLNVLFDPVRVNARISEFENRYQPEIQRHYDRWNSGWNPHATNVGNLRQFANERPQHMKQHIVDAFPDVTGTANITLQTDPVDAGSIEFSTLNLDADNLPWAGEYFTGVDIPVSVIPALGYIFEGWSDPNLGNALSTTINLSGDVVLTAHFSQGGGQPQNVVINEINYNSPTAPNSGDWLELYNPNNQTVDLSNWRLEDSGGGIFVIPNGTLLPPDGYLVLVENALEFSSAYPTVFNYLGDFGIGITGFKFSNNNELVVLKNANQIVIDTVHYFDSSPWPPEADGNGPTLQLIDPALDNALPQSWIAQAATPGRANTSTLQPQTIDFPSIPDKFITDQPFYITATTTSGLPVTFNLLSGPATLNGNVVTLDGVVGLVFIEATQPGNGSWEAAPPVTRAFKVNEPTTSTEYCGARGNQPWLEWISRVTFADLDHVSSKNSYGNFTNQTANVGLGEIVGLTVTPTYSWHVFDEYIRAWIDFNHDFDFDDPGEMVLEATGTGPVSTNVSIPLSAVQGNTRMRVAMQRGQYAGPCDTFYIGEVEDYTVNIGSNSGQQPQTIDFQAIPDQLVGASPFSLTATATSGLPVSFAIVSGPASLVGNVVTLSGTFGTVTIRASQPGNGQWQAAPPVDQSFEVVDVPQQPYCGSSGEQPWLEWIERVEFGSIDHSSFKEQYGDYTSISAGAPLGETITLRVTPAYSWQMFDEYFRAWIDFNHDNDFIDPGELVLEAIGSGPVSSDVLIPLTAVQGATRLRVSMQRGAFPVPCDDFLIGEVQDYTVVIGNSFNPDGGSPDPLNLVIAPNPSADRLAATFHLLHDGQAQLSIIDPNGVEIYSEKRMYSSGNHHFSTDISHLKSGSYMLLVRPERQRAGTGRFVKLEK